MYILFSPHQEKTTMFLILFFCGECEITKQFFNICPKLRKDKSNRYVGIKGRHPSGQNLTGVN